MTLLSRSRSVLTLDATQPTVIHYVAASDEGEEPRYVLLMERDHWDDMGQPSEVTLTVEPGDHLNGDAA